MKNSHIFEGSFVKSPDFAPQAIQDLARRSGLESLVDYTANTNKINHLLVKLFYANLNLDRHSISNQDDCIWTLICGVKIFLPLP